MPKQIANCPACNAQLSAEAGQRIKFCPNCGKPILWEQQPGARNPELLLEKACTLMKEGDFENAAPFVEEALAAAPEYSDAYIIRLLCKLKLKSISELGAVKKPLMEFEDFAQAFRYGSSYQVMHYGKLLEKNKIAVGQARQNNQTIQQQEQEILQLRKRIENKEALLAKLQARKPVLGWRKVLRTIELIVMICAVCFWTVGTLVVFPMIIFLAPFLLRLIFIIKRNRTEKLLPLTMQILAESIAAHKRELTEKQVLLSETTNTTAF